MSFSEVPRIQLNQDGTVTLSVNVGGFKLGTPVEISGYALQTNGAVAAFRDVQIMPQSDPVEGVTLLVKDVPVIGGKFATDDPIMVVAQVADIWITKLEFAETGDAGAAWNSDEGSYHSVFGGYPPPGGSSLATGSS
jgi:hypothetical protein